MPDGTKLSTQEFSKRIKAKYPEYKDMDDVELATKIIDKYPEYRDKVDLKKKEVTGPPSSDGSKAQPGPERVEIPEELLRQLRGPEEQPQQPGVLPSPEQIQQQRHQQLGLDPKTIAELQQRQQYRERTPDPKQRVEQQYNQMFEQDQDVQGIKSEYDRELATFQNEILGRYQQKTETDFSKWHQTRLDELQKQVDSGTLDVKKAQEILDAETVSQWGSLMDRYGQMAQKELQGISKRLQEEYSGKLGGLFEEKYGKAFDKDIQAIGRERDPVVAFTETMYNTLAHQIPGGYQSFMTAETAKIYQDASKRLKNLEDKYPDDSKTVDWKTELVPGVDKTAGAHKEYYRNKIKKTHEQMVKGLAKSQYYQNKMADENIVNTLAEIRDPVDALNYVFSAIGQSVAQIPTSLASFGTSTLVQEHGAAYLEGVNEIAQEMGITPQEVIEGGHDEKSRKAAEAIGSINMMLDLMGIGKVTGVMTKSMVRNSIRGKALKILTGGAAEGSTEALQSMVSQAGTAIGLGRDVSIDPMETLEEGVAGAIGGTVLSGAFQGGGRIQPASRENIRTNIQTDAEGTTQQISPESPAEGIQQGQQEVQQVRVRDAEQGREISQEQIAEQEKKITERIESAGITPSKISTRKDGSTHINFNQQLTPENIDEIRKIGEEQGAKQTIVVESLPEDVSPVIELQEEITVGNVTLAKGAQVDNVYQSLPDGSVTAPVYQLSYNTKFSDEQARQIGEALESAGITDYFIDQDNGTIETEYLDSSLVGKDYGQIFTKINEHATRFEEAARKIYDIIPTADYVTSKSVGIRRVRFQDSTLQRAEQPQGDIQEVSKTEKLSEINQELNKIREENPDQFRKDGMPKKNSKVFPAYMALSKERDAIAQEAISEFPELSRKEKEKSKEETAILNKEFEERRAELEKSLPEGDRVQAIIEEKMEYGQKLTPEEVAFANENFFRPEGYEFNEEGSLVRPREAVAATSPAETTTTIPKAQKPRTTPKNDLEEQLKTGEVKTSKYFKRMVKDPTIGDVLANQDPTYEEQSLKKAIKISSELVQEAKKNNDVDRLYDEVISNFDSIPALMKGSMVENLMDHYATTFDDEKMSVLSSIIKKDIAGLGGRLAKGLDTGRGEVAKTVKDILGDHAQEKTEKMGRDTEKKIKKLHNEIKANKEEIDQLKKRLEEKVKQLEQQMSDPEKAFKTRAAQRKAKVAEVKKKLNALKIKTDGQLNDISQVIGAKAWNAGIDAINTSLDAGVTVANAIDNAITAIKKNHKGPWDEDGFRAYMEGIIGPDIALLNEDMTKSVKKGLKAMGVKLNEIVDSHFSQIENVGKRLSDRFINEMGLDAKTAKSLEADVINTLKSIAGERQMKLLSERLGSEKLPVERQKRKKKEIFDQIITDINRGALTDDLFADLFADFYGFKRLTPEARRLMMHYADRMERLADYQEIYNRVANEFWNDLKSLGVDKHTISSVYLDLLYHGALSGGTTFARSTKGSLMTNIASMLVTTVATPQAAMKAWGQYMKGLPNGVKTAADTMLTGFKADDFKEFKPSGDSYVAEKMNTPLAKLIEKKDWLGVAAKFFYTAPGYGLRALAAWDAILKAGNKRFHGFMINYNKDMGSGAKEAYRIYSEETDTRLKEQAKRDLEHLRNIGEKTPYGYLERRVEELRENLMEQNVVNRIYQRSTEGVLMSDPYGRAGVFYRWLQKTLGESRLQSQMTDSKMTALAKLLGRSVFLIMRVPANFLNMNINYSPFGFIRALRGTLEYREGIYKMTPEERRKHHIMATAGTLVGTTTMMMLFDLDDEEGLILDEDAPIRLHGAGARKYKDNYSQAPDWKEWSIQFRLGKDKWSGFYSFKDNPIGAMLAPAAMISDEIRLRDFQKKVKGREYEIPDHTLKFYAALMMNGTLEFLMSQSYKQGMRDVKDAVLPYNNDYTKSGDKLEAIALRPIKTILAPNQYQQLYNYGKSYLDIPEKYAKTTLERMAKGTPLIESVLSDHDVDVFGYPIVRRFDVPMVPEVVLQRVKDNIDYREGLKEWQLVHKYPDVIMKPFSVPRFIDKKKLKEEYHREFLETAGIELREIINKKYDSLNEMNALELQASLDYYRSRAYDIAKVKIYKKYLRQ